MEEKEELELKKKEEDSSGKNGWIKYLFILLFLVIIGLGIFFLTKGNGGKNTYKIKIHNGNDIIEVDENFTIKDFDSDGGEVTFLVDKEGNVINPDDKLNKDDEYSTHVVPDGKEKVKVTYKNDGSEFSVYYQKGAGLLFPKISKKEGYLFLGWQDEETKGFPAKMTPVMKDMVLVAKYVLPNIKGGVCITNCDTKDDGICDANCDTSGNGEADKNIDSNNDGICDLNCDTNNDGKCDYQCDTNNDGKCDFGCEEEAKYVGYSKGTVKYDCDAYPKLAVETPQNEFLGATIDGKSIEPSNYLYSKYEMFDFSEYKGSGSTYTFEYKLRIIDSVGQIYYYTNTVELVFAGNCNKTNTDAINVEYTTTNKVPCENYDHSYSTKTENIVKKGLVINDKSTIKLIDTKLDGTSDKIKVDCNLDIDRLGWSLKYTSFDDVKELVGTRRGTTKTDVCKFEVVTDGKTYILTYNQTSIYAGNCSNDSKTKYTCPKGYTLSGTKCTKKVTETKNAKIDGYTCKSGKLEGKNCVLTAQLSCPKGYEDSATGCIKEVVTNPSYRCIESPVEVTYRNGHCYDVNGRQMDDEDYVEAYCSSGSLINGKCHRTDVARKTCPSGYSNDGGVCTKTVKATLKYSCSSYGSDYKLSGSKCTKTTTETIDATQS